MDIDYAKAIIRQTKENYDKIAAEFSNTRLCLWKDLSYLLHYTEEGDEILDLGCGNGRLCKSLKKHCHIHYTGVDFSGKLIAIARKNCPQDKFVVANALALPFQSNYFDLIYSIAVFHHIPSEELRIKFLEEAKRVLKPGGTLVLTVWKIGQPKSIKLIIKYTFRKILGLEKLDFGDVFVPWGKKYQRYVHNFSKAGLRKIAKKAGFVIEKCGVLKRPKKKDSNIYLVAHK